MVKNRATVSNSRTAFRIAIELVCVVAVVSMAAACGSDSGDNKKSDNPGSQFSGTYEAAFTVLTVNNKPPDTTKTPAKSTATWVVQSTCDGPAESCVAIASATKPDPKSNLALSKMEFVYKNGTWTRVFATPKRECAAKATKKPADEPWVAMHSTSLKSSQASNNNPIPALTGSFTYLQGGTCVTVSRGELSLRRTGDLPDGVDPIGRTVAQPVNVPSGLLSGTYDESTKPVSAEPTRYLTLFKPATSRFVAKPTCTRDGKHCVILASSENGSSGSVFGLVNGTLERSSYDAPFECTGGTPGYSRRTFRFEIPPGAASPPTTARGIQTITYMGGCPGTVRLESTITRTGD